jgi:PDZ domain-containing protein
MDIEALPPAPGAGSDPAPSAAAARARHRVSWPGRILLVTAIVVVIGVIAGFVVRMPYTTIAPGEALSLPARVSVRGTQSFPDERGDIRLLFVREANHVNFWQYLRARLDSDIDLARDADVNPGKLTAEQLNQQGLEQMAQAKIAATMVAMRAAGYDVKPAPGLRVHDLSPDMPAIDALQWGDVIFSADGQPITKTEQLSAAIDEHKVGDSVTLDVERKGKRMTIPVKIGVFDQAPGSTSPPKKGIGVVLVPRYKFPFSVSVDTTGIGGPSAGLAMALAITDTLTPGNLTGGRRTAVTGTIDTEGNVGEIGGIEQKAVAARAAGVSLFLVPRCSPDDPKPALAACQADLERTRQRAGSKIDVIPVSTFSEALKVLHDAGGAPVVTTVPTSTVKSAA